MARVCNRMALSISHTLLTELRHCYTHGCHSTQHEAFMYQRCDMSDLSVKLLYIASLPRASMGSADFNANHSCDRILITLTSLPC